jgi:hypothetical protein
MATEPISTLLASWYRWRLHHSEDLDRLDPQAERMRAIDACIEALPDLQGTVVRVMAAGKDAALPHWHHIGAPGPSDTAGLRQLEFEALAALEHRLRREGLIE